MRGMRRQAVFALLLLSLCVLNMGMSAEAGSGKCVFRGVSSHIYIYMKRDTFRLDYVDVSDQGESRWRRI